MIVHSLIPLAVLKLSRQAAFGGRDLEQEQILEGQLAIPGKVFAWVLGKIRGCHCVNGTHQARTRRTKFLVFQALLGKKIHLFSRCIL